ncbi:acyltransferase [Hoyosella rhizosphaerae]|uniref:Acyltransferase n=1 Tax=Hoyosella rhizosphaerae TaxID=1755582 RepID=A0A916XBV7_9ACTN|nr:acyltransferase [Hoyosella rhizosphaerae]MBN4927681.1 acyltransferase [Hoyosella rhizosphaerae]GGC62510.1 acyltransferase [Hoyosella rhizosphaerae]
MKNVEPKVPLAVAGSSGFLPGCEGMRGAAALGVLLTHVAFQTGSVTESFWGRVWGRFDLAVALFFALSGFLLWRQHARAARGLSASPSTGRYLRHRIVRIMPAYIVVVCAVLLLLHEARGASATVWWANLTLMQVFVPYSLVEGLTQMWSLSVELAFYLLLPLFGWGLWRLRGEAARWRVPVIVTIAVLSLAWKYIPVPTADGVHHDNWLPGYLSWFAAGMILAEFATAPPPRMVRLARIPMLMPIVAVCAIGIAASPLAGPPGLVDLEPLEYAVKILCGAVMGYALLAPIVLAEPGRHHRILASPTALMLGRWSYALFLWHVAVLMVTFPILGVPQFSGYMFPVLVLTVVLSVAVASVSYALVEEPARRALLRWETARAERYRRQNGNAETATAATVTKASA